MDGRDRTASPDASASFPMQQVEVSYQSALTSTLPGGSESLDVSTRCPRWRFSPKEASDERGDPNHSFGPNSVGASEFRQQVWRWRAGPPPSGTRVGAGRPFAHR